MALNIGEKKEKFINIKDVDGDFRVTEGVKNILIERNGITYIPFSEIQNLMGEYGGSPFTYTYKYSDWFEGSHWTVDKTSEGSYYLGEDLDSFNEYDLFNMVSDNLNHPNFGKDISELIRMRYLDMNKDSDGKWKKCEGDTKHYISFQLLVLYINIHYKNVIDILFHREEFEQLQYLIDY